MAKNKITLESLNGKLVRLDAKLDKVIDAMATKEDVERLERRVDNFDLRLEKIVVALDSLASSISKIQLEYAAMSSQLSRHDEWIHTIAKKTGIKLHI